MVDKLVGRERYEGRIEDTLVIHRGNIIKYMNVLAPLYASLNTAAFALQKPTEVSEAIQRLEVSDLLMFALDSQDNPVGFATYQLIPSNMGRIIYQARGLTAEAQGHGFGSRFPRIAVRELRANYLIAKAQNPISIWSTVASGVADTIYPLHELFSASAEMAMVLQDTVSARGKEGEVNLETGVHRSSYPMGKLGNFNPDFDHMGVSVVSQRLLALGVNVANGDAVYYGGKIV